jgi:hypothetical protein
MAGAKIAIGTDYTAGEASGDATGNLRVTLPTDASGAAATIGGVRSFSENDQGLLTGITALRSPEVDVDYRMRIAEDTALDEEVFNYTAQNTGKHNFASTTMTGAWSAGQFTTNASSITTVSTGAQLSTYGCFPNIGTHTLSVDFEAGFSGQPTTNSFVEFGLGIPGGAIVAPTDGVFFRLSSAGLQGIATNNGTETSTGIFPLSEGTGTWAYTNNQKYQFIVYMGGVAAEFWVNDGTGAVKLGELPKPAAQGRMVMASGMQMFFKHRIVGGAASGVLQAFLGAYNVRLGGSNVSQPLSSVGNRMYGAYRGLSGGIMGGLTSHVNSTNPTAAAPSNTALTANLPAGLGGQGLVTAAAGAATEGIWGSYQVPAVSPNSIGKRCALRGVYVDAVNTGAAVATTATTLQLSVAFGSTAVSLATAEAATAKAPARLELGFMTWLVGAAIGEGPKNGPKFLDLGDAPLPVNPGEFIQLVGKFVVGTATASQTIYFTWQPVYGWE